MPVNCPIGLIPFFEPGACEGCRYHWPAGKCFYFGVKDALPLSEIRTVEERVTLLERQGPDSEGPPVKPTGQLPKKSPPKLTGGVKLE